jgi:hypothetical protein
MILPTKHLSIDESILGGGAALLENLSNPKTVSRLWDKVKSDPRVGNFKRFSLLLVFLYSVDAILIADNLISKKVRR